MSRAASLPREAAVVVDAVRAATRRLVHAASEGDDEGVRQAIGERARRIDQLQHVLAELGSSVGEDERRDLVELLTSESVEAESALRAVQERVRRDLDSLSTGSRATRGYAAAAPPDPALDRSA